MAGWWLKEAAGQRENDLNNWCLRNEIQELRFAHSSTQASRLEAGTPDGEGMSSALPPHLVDTGGRDMNKELQVLWPMSSVRKFSQWSDVPAKFGKTSRYLWSKQNSRAREVGENAGLLWHKHTCNLPTLPKISREDLSWDPLPTLTAAPPGHPWCDLLSVFKKTGSLAHRSLTH